MKNFNQSKLNKNNGRKVLTPRFFHVILNLTTTIKGTKIMPKAQNKNKILTLCFADKIAHNLVVLTRIELIKQGTLPKKRVKT